MSRHRDNFGAKNLISPGTCLSAEASAKEDGRGYVYSATRGTGILPLDKACGTGILPVDKGVVDAKFFFAQAENPISPATCGRGYIYSATRGTGILPVDKGVVDAKFVCAHAENNQSSINVISTEVRRRRTKWRNLVPN